jgi:hypothetical protein
MAQAGVVELQIAAADVIEGADRLAVGSADVVEIRIEIGIDLAADQVAALTEVEGARRRNGHLRRDARVALEEAEVVEHRVVGEADASRHLDAFRLGLDTGELDAVLGGERRDAVEPLEEVEVPPRAAELTVGRALQADILLLADDRCDLAVLDRLERVRRDPALLMLRARFLEGGGPQQAADMIGAEGRRGAGHGVSSSPSPRRGEGRGEGRYDSR